MMDAIAVRQQDNQLFIQAVQVIAVQQWYESRITAVQNQYDSGTKAVRKRYDPDLVYIK